MPPIPWVLVLLRSDTFKIIENQKYFTVDKGRTELILSEQRSVGLYENDKRQLAFDSGTVYLTWYNLWWIDSDQLAGSAPESGYIQALQIPLEKIVKISVSGSSGVFNTSSPKIVLQVAKSSVADAGPLQLIDTQQTTVIAHEEISWECEICQCINIGPVTVLSCVECGIKRTTVTISQMSVGNNDEVPCSVCTYLNSKNATVCDMCGSRLESPSEKVPSSPAKEAVGAEKQLVAVAKLSFRNGGHKPFFAQLEQAIAKALWQVPIKDRSAESQDVAAVHIGVAGIISRQKSQVKANKDALTSGFADLESLQAKADDLYTLATSISQRLSPSSSSSATEPGDLTSLLDRIGVIHPVADTTSTNRKAYLAELSLQMRDFLRQVMPSIAPEARIISVTDLYCLFNRARGYSLVSPLDALQAVELLSENSAKSGFAIKRFPKSGIIAVQELESTENGRTRLLQLLLAKIAAAEPEITNLLRPGSSDHRSQVQQLYQENVPLLTCRYLASKYNLNPILVQEELLLAESQGIVCRDESLSNLTFHINPFV